MKNMLLRTRVVSEEEFWREFQVLGAIYFVRDDEADSIKVGYSRTPWTRLSNLQVGSARPLRLVGVIAAPPEVEPLVHNWLAEGRKRGEWFMDAGVVTAWLKDITDGEPMCRNVWTLVRGREVYWTWDEATRTHTKHVRNEATGEWEPPIT